jgi:hypothetical protein
MDASSEWQVVNRKQNNALNSNSKSKTKEFRSSPNTAHADKSDEKKKNESMRNHYIYRLKSLPDAKPKVRKQDKPKRKTPPQDLPTTVYANDSNPIPGKVTTPKASAVPPVSPYHLKKVISDFRAFPEIADVPAQVFENKDKTVTIM